MGGVWITTCVLLLVQTLAYGQTNLMLNPDFESSDYSDNWYCKGSCTLSPSSDAYSGASSVRVSNRAAKWNAVAQRLALTPGSVYVVTAYVKLLGDIGGAMYQEFIMQLSCQDAEGVTRYRRFGITPQVVPGEWRQLGGALRIEEGFQDCHVYIQTDDPAEYLADEARAVLVPDDDDWELKAQDRIQQNRQSNINIILKGKKTGALEVELTQNNLSFPLGSVVNAREIVNTSLQRYQDVFYDNFEWGLLGNKLKWRLMEWNEGNIDYDTPLTAMEALISRGIKTRCHCAFWAKETNVPNWVVPLSGADLKSAISYRIDYVMNATRGMCKHWDVNNENLHGDFFERQTGDPDITRTMFEQMHAVDPSIELYLNDYGIISGSDSAVAIKDTAARYLEAGVPVHGIGVQAHLKYFDVHLIKARLDLVAEAGLPVLITELAINDVNETSKAEHLTEVLTMLYSLPYVKGIVLWGFWEGRIWEPEAVLYTGDDVIPNEAGLAYENIFHNEWRTNRKLTGANSYSVRGFKGDYTLTVRHKNEVLATETFTLGDEDVTLQINTKRRQVYSVTNIAQV